MMNTKLNFMLGQALGSWDYILYGVGALILLVLAIVVLNFGMIWVRAFVSGAKATFTDLIALRLRNIPVGAVVDTRITAVKSGIDLTIDDLSTHFLAGGSIEMVVQALIAAKKAGIRLDFDRACAIDLATKGTGKNVIEAVKTSVNPKVIDCPNPASGKTTIDAVAKDGIVIKAKARVTVRTNLDRFVGGATEETIIARVDEGHRDLHRLRGSLQGCARKSRSHFQARARKRPRRQHRVRDPLHRHRRCRCRAITSAPPCRRARPRPTS